MSLREIVTKHSYSPSAENLALIISTFWLPSTNATIYAYTPRLESRSRFACKLRMGQWPCLRRRWLKWWARPSLRFFSSACQRGRIWLNTSFSKSLWRQLCTLTFPLMASSTWINNQRRTFSSSKKWLWSRQFLKLLKTSSKNNPWTVQLL